MRLRHYLIILLLMAMADAVGQESIAELQAAGLLEITWQVTPERVVVPGERIRIDITVATRRWFTGGTRIHLPPVPDMILKQNQQFATNASERRSDGGWTLQRWTIDASTVTAGNYLIPPIRLDVNVAGDAGRALKGSLKTDPIALYSAVPPTLQNLDHWVAAPELTLQESLSDLTGLTVGSAVRRTITLTATDVMAMQLPAQTLSEQPGLQGYSEPPVLRNRSNRGSMRAERRDSRVWIVTEPGTHTLPAATVNWWNTHSQTLEVVSLAPVTLTVSGIQDSRSGVNSWPMLGLWILAGLSGLLGWRYGVRRWALIAAYRNGLNKMQARVAAGWRALRRPPLPDRLNPGGIDSAPAASSRPEP